MAAVGVVVVSWVWSIENRAGAAHSAAIALGLIFTVLVVASVWAFRALRATSQLRRRLGQAERAAEIDKLTGLPN